MGFEVVMSSLPQYAFRAGNGFYGHFYLLRRPDGPFARPRHLDVFIDMQIIGR
jgi:hypothetical protein